MASMGSISCSFQIQRWPSAESHWMVRGPPPAFPRLAQRSSKMMEAPHPRARLLVPCSTRRCFVPRWVGAFQLQSRREPTASGTAGYRAAMISWDCSRVAVRLVFPPTSATSDPCLETFCSIQSTTVIHSIPRTLHFTPTLPITPSNQ